MAEYPVIDVVEFNTLLKGIRMGNAYSFECFYIKYGQMIFNTAFGYVGKIGLAEDVLNEVMLKILKIAKRYRKVKNPRALLYTITKNYCLNLIRENKKYTLSDNIYPEDSFNREESEMMFYDYVGTLPERDRVVIILKIVYGYTFKEIAEILKISDSNAEKIFYRAKEKIKL